jgi:hypothetical protein
LTGQVFAQGIGATVESIGQDALESVVEVQTLKDEVPEGDQGGEKPFIEPGVFKGRQVEEFAAREQADKKSQELRGSEGGGGERWEGRRSWFWFEGVFFDCI